MYQKFQGFEFMHPLVADIVQDDPTKRPEMGEVVTLFCEIKGKLSSCKICSRIVRRDEIWPLAVWQSIGHWYRTLGYILGRKAANPERKCRNVVQLDGKKS